MTKVKDVASVLLFTKLMKKLKEPCSLFHKLNQVIRSLELIQTQGTSKVVNEVEEEMEIKKGMISKIDMNKIGQGINIMIDMIIKEDKETMGEIDINEEACKTKNKDIIEKEGQDIQTDLNHK